MWYDECLSDDRELILRAIPYRIVLCSNGDALMKTVTKDIHEKGKILVVLSGCVDYELILNGIHDLTQLFSIYIFNGTPSQDMLTKYSKISGIFTEYSELENQILHQGRILSHQTVLFNFDHLIEQNGIEDPTERSWIFLMIQRCRFKRKPLIDDGPFKKKMLTYCRSRYKSNEVQLRNIDLFERTYVSEDAFKWYAKDCFLFATLNVELRNIHKSSLIEGSRMAYFAIELSRKIRQEWEKNRQKTSSEPNIFHVYRGLNLPDREINRVRASIGKTVSTRGFLSTTKSYEVARVFAANVIYDIEIDTNVENIFYADISVYSSIPWEEEVLFDYCTTFRVVDAIFDTTGNVTIIKLVGVDAIDTVINVSIESKCLEEGENKELLYCDNLVDIGLYDKACQYLQKYLLSTDDKKKSCDIHYKLGKIYGTMGKFGLACNHLQNAYSLCHSFNPKSDLILRISSLLSVMHACVNEHDLAFEHLNVWLEFLNATDFLYRSYDYSFKFGRAPPAASEREQYRKNENLFIYHVK